MVHQTFLIHKSRIKQIPVIIKHNKMHLEIYLAIISNREEIYLDKIKVQIIN